MVVLWIMIVATAALLVGGLLTRRRTKVQSAVIAAAVLGGFLAVMLYCWLLGVSDVWTVVTVLLYVAAPLFAAMAAVFLVSFLLDRRDAKIAAGQDEFLFSREEMAQRAQKKEIAQIQAKPAQDEPDGPVYHANEVADEESGTFQDSAAAGKTEIETAADAVIWQGTSNADTEADAVLAPETEAVVGDAVLKPETGMLEEADAVLQFEADAVDEQDAVLRTDAGGIPEEDAVLWPDAAQMITQKDSDMTQLKALVGAKNYTAARAKADRMLDAGYQLEPDETRQLDLVLELLKQKMETGGNE